MCLNWLLIELFLGLRQAFLFRIFFFVIATKLKLVELIHNFLTCFGRNISVTFICLTQIIIVFFVRVWPLLCLRTWTLFKFIFSLLFLYLFRMQQHWNHSLATSMIAWEILVCLPWRKVYLRNISLTMNVWPQRAFALGSETLAHQRAKRAVVGFDWWDATTAKLLLGKQVFIELFSGERF